MRASDRATREPPFNNEGLRWHPGFKAEQSELRPRRAHQAGLDAVRLLQLHPQRPSSAGHRKQLR